MSTRILRFLLISLIVLIVLAGAASTKQRGFVANCTGFTDSDTLVIANPDSSTTATLNVSSSVSLGKVKEHMQQYHRIEFSRWMINLWGRDYLMTVDTFTGTLKPDIKGNMGTGEAIATGKRNWQRGEI